MWPLLPIYLMILLCAHIAVKYQCVAVYLNIWGWGKRKTFRIASAGDANSWLRLWFFKGGHPAKIMVELFEGHISITTVVHVLERGIAKGVEKPWACDPLQPLISWAGHNWKTIFELYVAIANFHMSRKTPIVNHQVCLLLWQNWRKYIPPPTF